MTLKQFAHDSPDGDLFIGRNGLPGESIEGTWNAMVRFKALNLNGTVENGQWNWDGDFSDLKATSIIRKDDVYRITAN